MQPLDFYFDFSSPYGYIASHRIEPLALSHGREVRWRPYQLGQAFKLTGAVPLVGVALKGDYARRDFARSARQYGIPFNLPERFPINAARAARAFYWIEETHGAATAKGFAAAVYSAYFVEGRNIGDAAVAAEVGAGLGLDGAMLREGLESDAMRRRLEQVTSEAIERGAFGSPFILVDGEPFWGADRLPMIDEWLRRGGW